MKRVIEELPFWTGWMLNWIGRSYFSWTIWWNPQHKVNYLSLLHEAKHYQLLEALGIYEITRTFRKNKCSFCPWKWMPPEPENFWYRPRDMINLFNIGIKNSSKNEKKISQITSAVCWKIIINKIEIVKYLNKIQVDWFSEKAKSLNEVQLENMMCNIVWNIICLKQTTWL